MALRFQALIIHNLALLLLSGAVDNMEPELAIVKEDHGADHISPASLRHSMFHTLRLLHSLIRSEFSLCPFSVVIGRMCPMLKDIRLRSVLYAKEGRMPPRKRKDDPGENEESRKNLVPFSDFVLVEDPNLCAK